MVVLGVDVDKVTALGARGHEAVVAFETAPFGKVVGNVKGSGSWGRILKINKRDLWLLMMVLLLLWWWWWW